MKLTEEQRLAIHTWTKKVQSASPNSLPPEDKEGFSAFVKEHGKFLTNPDYADDIKEINIQVKAEIKQESASV